MDKKMLKKVTAKEVREWIDELPDDGEFCDPELISDRWSGVGSPNDGDYALIIIFHNKKEGNLNEY
jgi:hypothetical protein